MVGDYGKKKLAEVAARQLGIVASVQCRELGFSTKCVFRRVETGTWLRLHRGVYKVSCVPPNVEEREVAALLAAGAGAALSHHSAARHLGLDVPALDLVQLTIPESRAVQPLERVRVFRSTSLEQEDVRRVGPFKFTRVGRTILDLSAVLSPVELRVALDSGLRQRSANLKWIRRAVANFGKRHIGVPVLRALLDRYDEGQEATDSALESRFLALMSRFSPKPVLHYEVFEDGLCPMEVDFAWPRARLCVELDGYRYHASLDSFDNDRARDAMLAAGGWTVMRFTWRQVKHQPEWVLRSLRSTLERRLAGTRAA